MKQKCKTLEEQRDKLLARVAYYEQETDPEAEATAFLENLRELFVRVTFFPLLYETSIA